MGGDRVVKKSTSGGTRGKNGGTARGQKQTPKQMQKQKLARSGRRKAAAGTMRAILDEEEEEDDSDEEAGDEDDNSRERAQALVNDSSDSVSEDEDEDEDQDEDENEDEDESRPSIHTRHNAAESEASSPEPDFMLVEVIHHDRDQRGASTSSKHHPSEPDVAIPLALIHHIMQSQFTTPDKTSLSTDARSLLGKYVDAFVREGIHRCALGRAERDTAGGVGVGAEVGDSGWLEVEDLERVAVQLCLDF